MEIRISRESEVPLRQQLAEHFIYLIATGQLKAGEALPSVRELARRLKIHHNTVSEAYQDLVARTWLVGRRGSRVVVRSGEETAQIRRGEDLDDLINMTIRTAREQGYSLQELRERVRARLLAQPPDHFLIVEEELGLRRLLAEEIRASLRWPAQACSRQELALNPGLAIGAIQHPKAVHYRLISHDSLEYLTTAMASYRIR
jgi:GntR family transcriptional regulator